MAGSFRHIVDQNGAFTMRYIENMGDAHEALEECFDIIGELLDTGVSNIDRCHDTEGWLKAACRHLKYLMPRNLPRPGKRASD